MPNTVAHVLGERIGTSISGTYWHVGLVVPDLDAACHELTDLLGAGWLPEQERPDGENTLRVSFSLTEPYFEVIQGNAGGVWSTNDGPRVDHLAYWTDDYDADRAVLDGLGLCREAGGTSTWGGNWSYYRLAATGLRVELCDTRGRDLFLARWGLSDLEDRPASPGRAASTRST